MSPTRSTDTNLVWFSKNISFPCSKHCKGAEPPSPNLVVAPLHFQCQVKLLKEKKVTWQIVVSLPASEPFLADMAEPRPSRRMGMVTRSFMTVAFLVLVAFFPNLPAASPLLFTETKSITISRHRHVTFTGFFLVWQPYQLFMLLF